VVATVASNNATGREGSSVRHDDVLAAHFVFEEIKDSLRICLGFGRQSQSTYIECDLVNSKDAWLARGLGGNASSKEWENDNNVTKMHIIQQSRSNVSSYQGLYNNEKCYLTSLTKECEIWIKVGKVNRRIIGIKALRAIFRMELA
jgi:hypothetical protein